MSIQRWQKVTHAWAVRKKWRGPDATPRPLVADLMLFVSEAAEALEELRKCEDPQHVYNSYEIHWNGQKIKNLSPEQVFAITGCIPEDLNLIPKPEGFGPEIADLAIRIFETCENYGIDLDLEISRKMNYNETREERHGGLLM